MPQSEENLGDRTTIFRREDTVPVGVQEEFGHYLVVIGGTGRFQGASGQGTIDGGADFTNGPSDGTFRFTLTGTLSPPAG
jgi:hypothetical protein